MLTGVDAGAVDAAIGAWLNQAQHTTTGQHCADQPVPQTADTPTVNADHHADQADQADETDQPHRADEALLAVAVDGKTIRGAVGPDGDQVHLLAAATHRDQLVLGQIEVGAKTNEIPMFAPCSTDSPRPVST